MRRWTDEDLNAIYDSTSGRCHLCGKRLSWVNHGVVGARGAWHVDHSRARACGGSNYLRNLKPACIRCNCSKGAGTTRAMRARHGRSRAPLSYERRRESRFQNSLFGGGLGWLVGRALLGPGPAVITSLIGLALGHGADPDESD